MFFISLNFGWVCNVCCSNIETHHRNLSFLFSSFKYGFNELECRLRNPSLNIWCTVVFFIPRAWARDLMVYLLCNGMVSTCEVSISTFLRPQFLGFHELTSTGTLLARHCLACRQIRHTACRLTWNNSATSIVVFLFSFPRLLFSSNASYICYLWAVVRSFDLVLKFPFAGS